MENKTLEIFFIPPGEKTGIISKRSNFFHLLLLNGSGKIEDLDVEQIYSFSSDVDNLTEGKEIMDHIQLKGKNFVITANEDNKEFLTVVVSHAKLVLVG